MSFIVTSFFHPKAPRLTDRGALGLLRLFAWKDGKGNSFSCLIRIPYVFSKNIVHELCRIVYSFSALFLLWCSHKKNSETRWITSLSVNAFHCYTFLPLWNPRIRILQIRGFHFRLEKGSGLPFIEKQRKIKMCMNIPRLFIHFLLFFGIMKSQKEQR